MVKKHFERKTYEHKGIGVHVEIDYDNGVISLVESKGAPKRWLFAGREIEYMTGWQNILDAMKYAVKEATAELAAHQKAEEKEKLAFEKRIMAAAKRDATPF